MDATQRPPGSWIPTAKKGSRLFPSVSGGLVTSSLLVLTTKSDVCIIGNFETEITKACGSGARLVMFVFCYFLDLVRGRLDPKRFLQARDPLQK